MLRVQGLGRQRGTQAAGSGGVGPVILSGPAGSLGTETDGGCGCGCWNSDPAAPRLQVGGGKGGAGGAGQEPRSALPLSD
eukprot:3938776-Rhodomonas_salina.4